MKDNPKVSRETVSRLEGSGLQIGYGDHVIVDEMDVDIRSDRITTIIGPNGSGKSTVLKAITRLIRYQQGSVLLNGQDILDMKPKELARTIGVLPQVHSAPADFRVKELVSYGRMPHQKLLSGLSGEDESIIRWAMEATGTWQFRDKSIFEISGGERQRVWIATVLAQKPEILFLDEPTTYLDISHQLETMQLVKKLNRETGIGVVMVLHDLAQALEVSDHIIVIKNGRKYSEGAPEEVITPKMMMDVYKRLDLFKTLRGQWCLGSDEMMQFCGKENYTTLISAPFVSKTQRAAHLPVMGEKGMDLLLELKEEFLDRFED